MRRTWQRLVASLRPAVDEAPIVAAAGSLTVTDVVRRFWPRLRPLRGWLLLGMLLLAAAPAISVAEVMLFQRLVDDVLVPADVGPLLWLALAYVGLNLLSGVVSGADDYLSTWISQRFLVGLRRDSFAHVLSLPAVTHDRRRLGDVLTRLTSDVAAVESFMVGQLAGGVGAALKLVFFVGALFWLQWELALASMVVVPVFWWVSRRFADFTRDVSRERRRRGGSLGSLTEESLSNAALVQAFGREEQAVADYHRQNRAIAGAELAGSRVRAFFLPLVDLAELIGVLLVIGLGVWSLATDRLTLGGLLAFLTLLMQCYGPVRELTDLVPSLFSATAGVERLVELLDEPAAHDRPGATALPARRRAPCALRGVTVHLPGGPDPGAGRPRPRDRSGGAGRDRRGQRLRQVDRSPGCSPGSSTPTHGTGRDRRARRRRPHRPSVRLAVATVLQEQLMLDASVRDNIAFARPDATLQRGRGWPRCTADAHAFVERLPQGYDTRIGQRGPQPLRWPAATDRPGPRAAARQPGAASSTSRRPVSTPARAGACSSPLTRGARDRTVIGDDPRPGRARARRPRHRPRRPRGPARPRPPGSHRMSPSLAGVARRTAGPARRGALLARAAARSRCCPTAGASTRGTPGTRCAGPGSWSRWRAPSGATSRPSARRCCARGRSSPRSRTRTSCAATPCHQDPPAVVLETLRRCHPRGGHRGRDPRPRRRGRARPPAHLGARATSTTTTGCTSTSSPPTSSSTTAAPCSSTSASRAGPGPAGREPAPRLPRARAGARPRPHRRHRRLGAGGHPHRGLHRRRAVRRRGDVGHRPPVAAGAPPDADGARRPRRRTAARCATCWRRASTWTRRRGRAWSTYAPCWWAWSTTRRRSADRLSRR